MRTLSITSYVVRGPAPGQVRASYRPSRWHVQEVRMQCARSVTFLYTVSYLLYSHAGTDHVEVGCHSYGVLRGYMQAPTTTS